MKSAGFNVCEASDGVQALRCIEETVPDVVVLDIGLPMLDGMSVREELAAHGHTRDIPVIVVTGDAVDVPRLERTTTRLLRKPVNPSDLIAAVRAAIRSQADRTLSSARHAQPTSFDAPNGFVNTVNTRGRATG